MKISIIIIGYNSMTSLRSLLESISKLKHKSLHEVVYVDDGSVDQSVSLFKSFELKYNKKHYVFPKNCGRVAARKRGAEIATGSWLCFLQSNVVLHPCFIKEYVKSIDQNKGVAFAGKILYQSKDKCFEQYLNHEKRGLNQYKNNAPIHFRNLLFGNLLIKRSVFEDVQLNEKFIKYGGHELDFSYRLFLKYENKTFANKRAVVTRIDHQCFSGHCNKLYEYGKINFCFLSPILKKEVIKLPFLLKQRFVFKFVNRFLFELCLRLYKINLFGLRFYFIRLGMLCSILRGYYDSK